MTWYTEELVMLMNGNVTQTVLGLIIIVMVAVCRWLGSRENAEVKKELSNLITGLEVANVKGLLQARGYISEPPTGEKLVSRQTIANALREVKENLIAVEEVLKRENIRIG